MLGILQNKNLPRLFCSYPTTRSLPVLQRSYALSRFPDRQIGTGRKFRKNTQSTSRDSNVRIQYEETPSVEESPLCAHNQRRSSQNPESGLRRLLLGYDTLAITRQIEMLNIFMGFEQSNRYTINNEYGEPLGYIAEEPRGLLSTFSRQIFRTHRPFRAVVMDLDGAPLLWVRRPFAWINSRMFVQRSITTREPIKENEPVLDTFAEAQQRWHLWKRRYDLFLRDDQRRILSVVSEPQPNPETELFKQFAVIDEGLFAWHFTLLDARGVEIASVNRAFRGFGREIFTDTGQYFIRFTPSPTDSSNYLVPTSSVIRNLMLEERALVLAMSINIDFDYFSRHSEGGHGLGMGVWGGSWGSD